MAYINPFIKVNAGGIPRLSAINIPTVEAAVTAGSLKINNPAYG